MLFLLYSAIFLATDHGTKPWCTNAPNSRSNAALFSSLRLLVLAAAQWLVARQCHLQCLLCIHGGLADHRVACHELVKGGSDHLLVNDHKQPLGKRRVDAPGRCARPGTLVRNR